MDQNNKCGTESSGSGSGEVAPSTDPMLAALVDGARRGDAGLVSALLDHPPTRPYVTWAVFAAVAAGQTEIVDIAWRKTSASVLHDRDHLALRMAARRGDLAMVELLLSSGSLPGQRNRLAERLAALHGHETVLALLRSREAPAYTIDDLMAAARKGDAALVERMLRDEHVRPHVTRAVFAAVAARQSEVVRSAAKCCGAVVLHDREHLAFRIAARAGDVKLAGLLLGHGSLPDAKRGQAARLAQIHGHRRLMRLIENRGYGGRTVTGEDVVAAARVGDADTLDSYLDDPALAAHASRAAIAAVQSSSRRAIEMLAMRRGDSVLHFRNHLAVRIAARRGDSEMFELLRRHHSRVDAKDLQGLRLAMVHGHDAIVKCYCKIGYPLVEREDIRAMADQIGSRVSGPIVFLHIAKTAGSSLGWSLSRALGTVGYSSEAAMRGLTPLGYWQRDAVAAAWNRLTPREQSAPRLLSGHFSYRVREVLPPSRLFISMIRHPVDRLISGMYYGSSMGDRPASDKEFKRLFDWETEVMPADRHIYMDHQVRVLSGNPLLDPDSAGPRTAVTVVTEEMTDAVLREAAENFVLLGVTERYEDSVLVLARQLGLPLTCFVDSVRNQTAHRLSLDDVPKPALDLLMALNQQDLRLYTGARRLLDKIIEEDKAGFERDRDIYRQLGSKFAQNEGYGRLLAFERNARGRPPPRLYYPAPAVPAPGSPVRSAYLDLMEDVLINRIYEDPSAAPWNQGRYEDRARDIGSDWPSRAHSMIGKTRMRNLRQLTENALAEGVPGDFLEAGVWRGGATIMMRAVLKAHDEHTRMVWVADSFTGVPPPNEDEFPADKGDLHHTAADMLAISQAEVAANFRKYGLLDRQVRFLPGLFKDTLASAPIEKLAVLRLDGDLYESTLDTLTALYDKVSPGGYVIVDDYGAVPGCKQAIEDFRRHNGLDEPLEAIDWAGVYWRKRQRVRGVV